MKSILTILLLAAAAGGAVGASVGYLRARVPDAETASAEQPSAGSIELPKAEFPETSYDFGTMEQNTSLKHAFVVRNTGSAPLEVRVQSTTCKCTVGNLAEGESAMVSPGEQTEVELEWTAKTGPGPFRHGAKLRTTDPQLSNVDLTVEGTVVESTALRPTDFRFGTVRAGEQAEASVYLMSFVEETIEIGSHEVQGGADSDSVKVTFEEIDPEEIGMEGVKAALRMKAEITGGDYVGPFYGTLRVETSLEQASKLSIPLSGRVVGDVSIFGKGWSEPLGVLSIGTLKSAEGGTALLHMNIRGEAATDAEFTVESVDPPALKVEVGEGEQIVEGLVRVPLSISVPPGTPPLTRSGGPASDLGEVVLKSNLPNTKEIRLSVRVAVQP